MLKFDKAINQFINNNGIYRRYSDDMIIVCSLNSKEELSKLVHKEIEKSKLEIQDSKTQIFHFKRQDSVLTCGQEFEGGINWNKNFIYLGFEFDGETALLKSSSLSGYYRKMKRSIRRAHHFSSYKNVKNSNLIFKRRLFKRFSYKGAKRYRKWIWNEKEKMFEKSNRYNWGNFLSYANKASQVMTSNKIKQQTSRHWNILNKLIK